MVGCYIRVAGRLLDVTDGWVVNGNTQVAERLQFLYLSPDDTMVVIERPDALHAMRQNLQAYADRKIARNITAAKSLFEQNHRKLMKRKVRMRAQRRLNRTHQSMGYFNRSSSPSLFSNYSFDDYATNGSNNDYRLTFNSRTNKESHASIECESYSLNFSRNIDKERRLEEKIEVNKINLNNSAKKTEFKLQLDIDAPTLNVIRRWISKNTTFICYKGQTDVPDYLFDVDKAYFKKVLFALNPIIQIERCTKYTKKEIYVPPVYQFVDIQSQISQNEFVQALGLKQVKSNNNTKISISNDLGNNNEATSPDKQKSVQNQNSRKGGKKKSHSFKAYSKDEDKLIIEWVLAGRNATQVNGNRIWKQLEEHKTLRARTWQSLRSRYIKTILFKLRDYGLNYDDEMKLKIGAERGSMNKMKMKIPDYGVNKENSARTGEHDSYEIENISEENIEQLQQKSRRKSNRTVATDNSKKSKNKRKLFTENDYIASASSNL